MTNSRPLTTERLTAGCDSPNLLLNDACDTPSGDRDAVDYRYKLLENGTILFSPVKMSKFKSWPLGDVFDFVAYSIIQQLPLIQRLQTSFHPGHMTLKCFWLVIFKSFMVKM
ncbi:MAG: hypothetical protein L6406_18390 [Desulfobacterales bacterium]|nr:hypothetical protein [Desulfobacterales bacterium]